MVDSERLLMVSNVYHNGKVNVTGLGEGERAGAVVMMGEY